MSLTTLTIGGESYIGYATLSEANIALAVDPVRSTAWTALADEAKNIRLVSATRRLDILNWAGQRTVADQGSAWPRSGLTYEDDGGAVDSAIVPDDLERATILLAGSIAGNAALASAGTAAASAAAGTLKKVKAGAAEVEYFSGSEGAGGDANTVVLRDQDALLLIQQWLETGGSAPIGASVGQAAFGTCDKSSFTDQYPYGRSGAIS